MKMNLVNNKILKIQKYKIKFKKTTIKNNI